MRLALPRPAVRSLRRWRRRLLSPAVPRRLRAAAARRAVGTGRSPPGRCRVPLVIGRLLAAAQLRQVALVLALALLARARARARAAGLIP